MLGGREGPGMVLNYDEVVRGGLARQIADTIRAAILDGRLKVDERLPTEEELARRFGISRPTVREALKRLAAQNLVQSRRGPTGGTFVARPDPAGLAETIATSATLLVGFGAFDIDQIVTARRETEAICCRLAAQHRTPGDLDRMRAEIATQETTGLSDEAFCASDVRFHRALVEAGRNGPLSLMMHAVIEAFIPITNLITFRLRDRREVAMYHRRIVAAVEARDGAAAEAALGALLDYLRAAHAAALAAREARAADKDHPRGP
ncbi:FadR/GntR family transcriptional regulator [Frigidibacter sp. MR17.24]|uniref:FadR/GntR family transcriptional regulator n=1 Tax=Frigidibacter sp. MR17.24 TaxID=3127345 RepID=UPI003012D872